MAMQRLLPVSELHQGLLKPVEVDGRSLLLAQGEDGPALVDRFCPHAGGDLAQGEVTGDRLRCPVHRFFFDLRTGGCAAGRREGWGPLGVYPVSEVDGFVCADT